VVLCSAKKGRELGLKPMARLVAVSQNGVDPKEMGMGPVPATRAVLKKAAWSISDLDLIEINEAFAAQSIAVMRELGLASSITNVHGGSIALGHPIGCSGARILVTLLYAMKERNARRGLASLCIGGGMGVSALVENL
jgi:acetyl-CoA C-acetyltransferase